MFESLQSIIKQCESDKKNFAQIVIENEMKSTGSSKEKVMEKMKRMWSVMLESSESYQGSLHSKSGLSGGDGGIFSKYAQSGKGLSGGYISSVISEALKIAESNACMKRIVACPTAGSCGVLPSVLIPLYREKKFPEEKFIEALFVAAGIGQVIANKACISGAQGGCQAEIGSASAMAGASLVYLSGGNERQIAAAVGFCLQNLLGLVCDPVAGYVEIPCIKRNVIGAVNAVTVSDMVMAGLKEKIPADEIIEAMDQVGRKMDSSLRETGEGGIAACKTAREIVNKKEE
ncbi:MAG: L-serine ammonia-lyase, iron-sulfur-dependent, subunit alpha [Treponema sp.]|nr:L-serine ammonia-lyase, iron-sulfur-dependent, subunit alpha [Treponema sp.]